MREQLGAADSRQAGPYRLVAALGRGGMGRVFLGRSRGGRLVAVKVVDEALAGDEEFRRRFAQATQEARRVGGFYTAQVVDADPDADPPWLASAYVPGPSLDEAVRAHGPLPYQAVQVLGSGLAEGLAAIHTAQLVHGGLKPSNVILADDGPRITDFALARALDAAHPSMTVSAEHGAFMSPEAARGQHAGPGSDVFSLAGVLVFAATGHGPFAGGVGAEVLHRIVNAEPDLTGVPDPLAGLLAACLAKNPEQRPSLGHLLQQLAPGDGQGAGQDTGWLPPPVAAMVDGQRTVPSANPMRRRAFLAGGVAAAAAVAVPVGIWLSSGSGSSDGKGASGSGSKGGGSAEEKPAGPKLTPTETIDIGKTDASIHLAYSPDGKQLAIGLKSSVTLWDSASRSKIATLTPKAEGLLAHCVAFGGDGLLALGYLKAPARDNDFQMGAGGVTVWDTASRKEIAALSAPAKGSSLYPMQSVAFSPDGKLLAGARSGPRDSFGEVPLWDVRSGRKVKDLVVGAGKGSSMNAVRSVAFSPDGRILAAGYGGELKGGVVLFDTSSWSPIATLPLNDTDAFGVTTVAFAPDGRTLAGTFGGIALWDVAARKLTARIGAAADQIQSMAISPDGSAVAGAGGGHAVAGHIALWDLASHKEIVSVPAGRSGVGDVVFHPDGRTLATAYTNAKMLSTVQLWTVE
ncbi:serine/threonine-protein kinase [Streptomyces sp. NBC_01591]|uniref:WD40 repeat domain-containing serine/threonine protein kinase n=1 Tax=Streptomyces sp. NBC_01591 TaxID=2975888 RepID=UPI002DDC4C05|nr:serine/threonine-protein kinase [Streptomyces sp. NBC_01591]WSD72733.1 serine/threonine-protein kinase [Streptomyces sp. NBC_01591]